MKLLGIDVTLSIIKNGQDEAGVKQKVYYSENVYRISGSTRQFKEIMQTGLECIGDIDLYDVFEVISLACASLKSISDSFVIELSHLGVLSSLLDSIGGDEDFKFEVMECIKQKNAHELKKICKDASVPCESAQLLCDFVTMYGDVDSVISRLESLKISESFDNAVYELKQITDMIKETEYKDNIRLDFSIVNDMNYYNGVVFNGFVEGVCETVLFGGRYDKLLNKMGRNSKGIGFAVYVDLLESLSRDSRGYDVDVLVLYSDSTDAKRLDRIVKDYISKGYSVTTQKAIPEKIRYKELVREELYD